MNNKRDKTAQRGKNQSSLPITPQGPTMLSKPNEPSSTIITFSNATSKILNTHPSQVHSNKDFWSKRFEPSITRINSFDSFSSITQSIPTTIT